MNYKANFNGSNAIGNGEVDSSILSGSTIAFFGKALPPHQPKSARRSDEGRGSAKGYRRTGCNADACEFGTIPWSSR